MQARRQGHELHFPSVVGRDPGFLPVRDQQIVRVVGKRLTPSMHPLPRLPSAWTRKCEEGQLASRPPRCVRRFVGMPVQNSGDHASAVDREPGPPSADVQPAERMGSVGQQSRKPRWPGEELVPVGCHYDGHRGELLEVDGQGTHVE